MSTEQSQPRRGSLESRGTRVLLAVLFAGLSWAVWPVNGLPLIVGLATYVLLTAVVGRRRP